MYTRPMPKASKFAFFSLALSAWWGVMILSDAHLMQGWFISVASTFRFSVEQNPAARARSLSQVFRVVKCAGYLSYIVPLLLL